MLSVLTHPFLTGTRAFEANWTTLNDRQWLRNGERRSHKVLALLVMQPFPAFMPYEPAVHKATNLAATASQ